MVRQVPSKPGIYLYLDLVAQSVNRATRSRGEGCCSQHLENEIVTGEAKRLGTILCEKDALAQGMNP